MSISMSRECSKERLQAELEFGQSLRDRAFREETVSIDSPFDSECRDWCESLAFAINFAFDGEARSFLSTLGLGHDGSGHTQDGFRDWSRPWSNPAERIQAITLYIRLLQKWVDKLHEKFRDEDEAIFSMLDYMFENGGAAAPYSIQLACEMETPIFNWLLHSLKSDRFIDQRNDEIVLTDAGMKHRKSLLTKIDHKLETENRESPDPDHGLWINTWVGIVGIIMTVAGIAVSVALL